MPARKSFLEAPDAFEPFETSWREDSQHGQRRINKRSTIRSERSSSTFSSAPGTSRTVTKVTITQSRSGSGLDGESRLERVLRTKPSVKFATGSASTGMLTLLGQHFPELMADGAFRTELERVHCREPHSTHRFRKDAGSHRMGQDAKLDGTRLPGSRHREYYSSSWKSTSSGRSIDPKGSVVSLRRTTPAGVEHVESSVRSRILRSEPEGSESGYPEVKLETAKTESSSGSDSMSSLASSERSETPCTSPSEDGSIFEQNAGRLENKSGIAYQSYVEDDAEAEESE
ncbi:hypothetical protein CERZMDRAFT_101214 [Cercospora zeae-maydis SCOH1-5]|uniref:Uncharacterized protein n=1 Tax=Cercospora zeae-maydis SCOH1-5 TaxID=717836 RepID=A0A6A6F7R9_9PEZI|nr:hypothetical protein CERZMDRAFT_101214 [Cercospora zeae-maydis SCOH1-5]